MSEEATKIFNALVQNDEAGAKDAFNQAIESKMKDAMEVRKVGLTSEIFNKTKEES
jgi:hypothetical protein